MNHQVYILVGGFNPSEKYLPVGSIIPHIWKNKKCSKSPSVYIITLWLFNIAMENGQFIDGLPIKNCDFPWLC